LKRACSGAFYNASLAHQPQYQTVLMNSAPPMNWTPPERMTPSERLDELAQILSAGLRRILPNQSSTLSGAAPDSLVDFSPLKSGVHRRKLRNRVGG
jgi:hypothetical protein